MDDPLRGTVNGIADSQQTESSKFHTRRSIPPTVTAAAAGIVMTLMMTLMMTSEVRWMTSV